MIDIRQDTQSHNKDMFYNRRTANRFAPYRQHFTIIPEKEEMIMRNYRNTITQERLQQAVSYDPNNGLFFWRAQCSNRAPKGSKAGTLASGYISIRIDGVIYRAHRLAWLYVYGAWPEHELDHINGDKTDNRIINLRDVNRSANNENLSSAKKQNKSGHLGVTTLGNGKFLARIQKDGNVLRIGIYETAEDAHVAYKRAKSVIHKHSARIFN